MSEIAKPGAAEPFAVPRKRRILRLPDKQDRSEVAAMLTQEGAFATKGQRRQQPYLSNSDARILITELSDDETAAMRNSGAMVYEDVQFSPFCASGNGGPGLGLTDVLQQIRAPEAWQRGRGSGATIAIVDTGIHGDLREIPTSKRVDFDLESAFHGMHWNDEDGHGSMCAAIAAGTDSAGGRYCGVAPDANVLSARTLFWSLDIYKIYDQILDTRLNGPSEGPLAGPLVVSNSYGLYTCSPPGVLPIDHPYMEVVLEIIKSGATVVFAAGNNHADQNCQHDPTDCRPNTIWGPNSHDNVISVGSVNREETNRNPATAHVRSSRGPGEWAQEHPKPDCVAPTYGEVVWGQEYRHMEWWGTSGACPQVAGLAALLLGIDPSLRPEDIGRIIRDTARTIDGEPTCVGQGIIDCRQALDALP
jgi:subtilisin family serine protease